MANLDIIELPGDTLAADIIRIKLCFRGIESSVKSLAVERYCAVHEQAWYFDEYAQKTPFDAARAAKATALIKHCTSDLYETLELWQYDSAKDGEQTLIINVFDNGFSESKVHQIAWECLEANTFRRCWETWETVIVRRRVGSQDPHDSLQPQPSTVNSLNILVVASRKDTHKDMELSDDITYQRFTAPIVEIIETVTHLTVHVTRPGTFRAFKECLESKPTNYYSLVHFDLYGRMTAGNEERPSTASLGFENSNLEGDMDYVGAKAIASLVVRHGVPIVTLNACHSADATQATSNLAHILAKNGVQHVMGMSYTLLESAGPIFLETLLRHLLIESCSFAMAVRDAREALREDVSRIGRFGKRIHIDDFLVPVTYSSTPELGNLSFLLGHTDSTSSSHTSTHSAHSLKPVSTLTRSIRHVFHLSSHRQENFKFIKRNIISRDRDILNVERILFSEKKKSHILFLHGAAGSGKTTFLTQISDWWEKTGFVETGLILDYDAPDEHRNPRTIEYLHDLLQNSPRKNLENHLINDATSEDMLNECISIIRKNRFLLALDHLEFAVRTSWLHQMMQTTESPLNKEQLGLLKSLIRQLSEDSGQSVIVLSTRNSVLRETWLHNIPVDRYEIEGLPLNEAMAMTTQLLYDNSIHEPTQKDFMFIEQITQLLDQLPWALHLVIPELAKRKGSPDIQFSTLFSEDQKNGLIADTFPIQKFDPLQNLLIKLTETPTLGLVLLSTVNYWRRIPRMDLFTQQALFHLVDFRQKDPKPDLNAFDLVNDKYYQFILEQTMVELGWWIPESEEYYKVNPLLQLFLRRLRQEWDGISQYLYPRLTHAAILKLPKTENFETSFIMYHTQSVEWTTCLHDDHIEDFIQRIAAEYYSFLKAIHLASICVPITSPIWPVPLLTMFPCLGQSNLISKRQEWLVIFFIEHVLHKYESEELRHRPPALPLNLIVSGLELFSLVNDYYYTHDSSVKYIEQTDRALQMADRAIKAHGDLPPFAETKRRYILEHKAKQFLLEGKSVDAEKLLRDNIVNTPRLPLDHPSGLAGLINEISHTRQLKNILALPHLFQDEIDDVSGRIDLGTRNVKAASEKEGLSQLHNRSKGFAKGHIIERSVCRPTYPHVQTSSCFADFPEQAQRELDRINSDSKRDLPAAKRKLEMELAKSRAANDIQSEIQCHAQLSDWAIKTRDSDGVLEHCKCLLDLRDHMSPEAISLVRLRYAVYLQTFSDEERLKSPWYSSHEYEEGVKYLDNVSRDLTEFAQLGSVLGLSDVGQLSCSPEQESPMAAAMPMRDIVDIVLPATFGFRQVDDGSWEAPHTKETEKSAREIEILRHAGREELDRVVQPIAYLWGRERAREYLEELTRRKYVLI